MRGIREHTQFLNTGDQGWPGAEAQWNEKETSQANSSDRE
jgi:hypothetical protein